MSSLQYIGARYVPAFYENPDTGDMTWKSGVGYEPLTVVTYNSDTYTSKKPVPSTVGDPASNPTYWAKTADYNAAIEALEDEIEAKTSPEYIQGVMEGVPVNKWFADNEPVTGAGIGLNELTFAPVSEQFCNFKNELLVDEWKPFNDDDLEFAVHPSIETNAPHVYLENGVRCQSTESGRFRFNINNVFYVKNNMCVKFRVNGQSGSNATTRVGISFRGKCSIYFDNQYKHINYETDSESWSPTALNNKDFSGVDHIDIMCFMDGKNVAVYASADDAGFEYMGTTPTTTGDITGEMRTFIQTTSTSGVCELTNLKLCYTFAAFADCKYIHYDDTTPYIQDGKAYMTATLQAYGCHMTGILRHTLGFNDLELVGIISADGDPAALGTDMCFDRKNKRFITMFRLDKDGGGNKIGYAISHNNNLFGIMDFDATDLPTVAASTDFGNYSSDEDPAVCFFDGHWYVAINRIQDSPYIYEVFKTTGSDFDVNDFEHVSTISSASLTGASFIVFNGELYLVAGNGDAITVFNANTGVSLGSLGVTVANRVWGNITVINRGNKTKVYLTTFDRNKVTTSAWSYGAIHMYESTDDLPELVVPNTYSW